MSSVSLRIAIALGLCASVALAVSTPLFAEDVAHMVSGVVKHIDKDSKTMVVKTADGTEHTIKWTDQTSWQGVKDMDKDVTEGTKVSVKYTEKAGEKTAVGVKKAAKDTAKAMQ
jgi:hypothetical protein